MPALIVALHIQKNINSTATAKQGGSQFDVEISKIY